ncbi:leucyl aminopeptidase family protein [Aquibaculum arenosum]|uniref:Leucyl aminopeptidase family protein n=1 Tax=Aquibaculum arenosum TaxID=3032591 RepID=A0ABT5YJC6_9PROT|nr:leucyl aminopeptidase family protein [Fodinicurvata sp. CAU 1616]MDF2094916.1 leucyl aminopeptidase family protein [Fodinicurvata sp. CAU 1616]
MTETRALTALLDTVPGESRALRRLQIVTADGWEHFLEAASPAQRAWLEAAGFQAKRGRWTLLPENDGTPGTLLAAVESLEDLDSWSALAASLPAGDYALFEALPAAAATRAALGWALGGYAFTRYRKASHARPRLLWPEGADRAAVARAAEATYLVRDLINTPAGDLGPAELAEAAQGLARRYEATCRVIVGETLLEENWPAVHAVGRAASPARAPRLIDLRWGTQGPKVTLVGKGVCFDTGGLDLKPSSGMLLMKKDMGGAAHALGLAQMIMAAELPLQLRVLVPAVENAVSGDSFRPMDVLATRKGLSVEVGNTDAEGRLILCDALAEASEEAPDLLVDMATLTGAARVALGPDLPALFCNDEGLAAELLQAGEAEADPLWRLPLHKPYAAWLDSKVADLNNVSSGPFAGAITAALFLERFVAPGVPWVHLDLFGWNPNDKPGRPKGGADFALRALYRVIAARCGG